MKKIFNLAHKEHLQLIQGLSGMRDSIVQAGRWMVETLRIGGKILVCGNGGSAADAQHFAAELVGRFKMERPAWPAIALTTDTSILTAIANDYSFDRIFARQVEALGKPGDLLLGISTSGNSSNVCLAMKEATARHMKSIALTGGTGGALGSLAELCIAVPCDETCRIQEAHIFVLHLWCEMIEGALSAINEPVKAAPDPLSSAMIP